MKTSRRLSLLLALLIILSLCFTVNTAADESSDTSDPEAAISADPGITPQSAVSVYCVEEEQYLYYHTPEGAPLADTDGDGAGDEYVMSPGVLTKLMTCMVVEDILAERNADAEDVTVTITAESLEYAPNYYDIRIPVMGFSQGNTCSTKDLISAALVANHNDAAAALADHYGRVLLNGDMNTFIQRMNEKAQDLGMTNTVFTNPTGIEDENQKTTLNDATKLISAFYKYNELKTLSDVASFSFNGSSIKSKNYLKSNSVGDYINLQAIGLIAGQSDPKSIRDKTINDYCLATATQKDGKTYVYLIAEAKGIRTESIPYEDSEYVGTRHYFEDGNAYDDMNKLINWAHDAFELVTIDTAIIGELRVKHGNSVDHVMVYPQDKVEKLVLAVSGGRIITELTYDSELIYTSEYEGGNFDTIDAPVDEGQTVGTVTYYYQIGDDASTRMTVATIPAIVRDGSEVDRGQQFLDDVGSFLTGTVMQMILWTLAGLVGAYIVVVIVMSVIRGVIKVRGNSGKVKFVRISSGTKKQKNKKAVEKSKTAEKAKAPEKTGDNTSTRQFD